MATTDLTQGRQPQLAERIQTVIEVSAARVAAVWKAAMNRRAIGQLAEWDERMLRDIGLTRNDVTSALAGGVTEDPSRQLQVLSGERRAAERARRHEEAVRRAIAGRTE